jgi:hypothetical protein
MENERTTVSTGRITKQGLRDLNYYGPKRVKAGAEAPPAATAPDAEAGPVAEAEATAPPAQDGSAQAK